jgi:hypothetical protein
MNVSIFHLIIDECLLKGKSRLEFLSLYDEGSPRFTKWPNSDNGPREPNDDELRHKSESPKGDEYSSWSNVQHVLADSQHWNTLKG